MENNFSVNNEGVLMPAYKEKYQNKLQNVVTEIVNDPESNKIVGTETVGTQQEYILTAVHFLIEIDKTGELMRVLVENFGDELSVM
ncbi:MAG: hypothetical protein JWQ09_2976 [Segetibacter sp.]|nr:hypothetical protein [Segetibacter sp.]